MTQSKERSTQANQSEEPIWKQLQARRGAGVKLIFLTLTNLERPVGQADGVLDYAREEFVSISLRQPLPSGLTDSTRFTAEILLPVGIVYFQSPPPKGETPSGTQLRLRVPDRLERVQRRRLARAMLSSDVLVQGGANAGLALGLDFSGGGISFASDLPLRFGDHVLVSFGTKTGERFDKLPGEIVRISPDTTPPTFALRFIGLTDQQESDLMKSVFKVQMKRS